MKRVNTFVDYRTELVEGSSKKADAEIAQESSSKRARDELEQESIKKQKVDEDKETAELKSLMEVIPDEEEVAVDAIPLATKPLSIVDWKIHKEGKKTYYQIKPVWNNAQRVNHQNFAKKTHPCAKKNMVPRAVLMKSDLVSINTARQFNAAHTTTTVNFAKPISTKNGKNGAIRCDNGTEIKNKEMNQFYEMKGILRQYIVARTPQQNRFAERRNRTLIEAARTMLGGTKASDNTGQARKETEPKVDEDSRKDSEGVDQEKEDNVNSTNNINAARTNEVNVVGGKTSIELPLDPNMPELEDYSIFDSTRNDEDNGAKADMNNLDTTIQEEPKKWRRALNGKRAIGTKWVFRNKKDERGIVIRNKARLVTQGYTQEEGIDYDEVWIACQMLPFLKNLQGWGMKNFHRSLHSISTIASAVICLATNQKFNFSKYIFESMVKNLDNTGVNTPQSDEDRLKLNELMEFCTKLQQRVLDLENTKTAQAQEITSLKLRVKKLEKKGGSRTHKLKRLYKVGRSARVISSDEASLGDQEDASKQGRKIDDIDKDAEITLVDETQGRYGDEEMFDTCVLDGDEVLAEPEVTIKDVNLSVDEVTLAQALAALKSAKVQEKANLKKKKKGLPEKKLKEKKKPTLLHGIIVEGSEVRAEGSETRTEGSSKRAGEDLQQESIKKQKVDEDNETTELQRLIEVVPNKEDVEIDVIPLATKPLSIVDYKIHKEGKKTYYQIIRADGSSKMYLVFSHMLKRL
ncbi:putative reverse transcriptase domain-containing protein [Tanacetum coccineum]|uniref:Reverse transcriptase domain-containing protein n=1 Tax=Tanacetum coccineum TaxID=301880 RepID=A0ABQ4YNN6_9ASTR